MKPIHLKVNHFLVIICSCFLLIGVRVFHLGIIQRDSLLKEALKPKTRSLLLRAERGEVCDRFQIPMAVNRICYNAAVYYSEISQIPSRSWEIDKDGKQVRTYPRREHIKQLSLLLQDQIGLDSARTEDLIHAKASILPHVPYILKTNLTEEEYYRLKMLEKDFPGLHAEMGSKRYYPLGKVGCHILGTMGSISSLQYMNIAEEIRALQEAASAYETFGSLVEGFCSIDEIYQRLDTLKDKAYSFNDKVGKSGIELSFEEDLRGSFGLKTIEVDNQGKPLKELPGTKAPIPGKKVTLSISSELQQFAEELLIQNESFREGKSFGPDPITKARKKQKQPWIKGGAIVAMDPKTGELLALASNPRFDPNDFVDTSIKKLRYLETEKQIGALWDGKDELTRERVMGNRQIEEEKTPISWEFYLREVLPQGSLKSVFDKVDDISGFVNIQEDFQDLLYFSKGTPPEQLMEALTTKSSPLWETLRSQEEARHPLRRLDAVLLPISSTQDRLFAVDLCRLCIHSALFSDELLEKIGSMKVTTYRKLNQAFCRFATLQKQKAALLFHRNDFPLWREENQRKYLSELRTQEKKKKTPAKPYIEYLDRKEKELFEEFWKSNGLSLMLRELETSITDNRDIQELQDAISALPEELASEFILTFRSFETLDLPLYTKHPKIKTEKELASLFYPDGSFGYTRSYAFQAPSPQGSVFKIVSGYEGLRQGHTNFTMIDEQATDPKAPPGKNLIVGYTSNRTPFPRIYKGGRLPKTARKQVGKIDIAGALEFSSNPYFSILAGDYLKNPDDLNTAALGFGYGNKTGIDLPFEGTGALPTDLKSNRTGLYSYAIGQHTFLCTPLQSALMLSTIANGGKLLKPQIIKGQEEVRKHIEMSPTIKNPLLDGLDRCVWSDQGCARVSIINYFHAYPETLASHLALKHQLLGKTGTAEVLFNPGRYPSSLPQMYKHTWFGSIAYGENSLRFESPELVVVVFFRFGTGGKEGAPIASQMVNKWREIQKKYR